VSAISTVVVLAGVWHFFKRQYTSYQERSVRHLLESSRAHEAGGRLTEALIDLDAALEIARDADPAVLARLGNESEKRRALAQRDAHGILEKLGRSPASAFRLGEWLNLKARVAKDADLKNLAGEIDAQFEKSLQARVDFELANAQRAFESLDVVAAINDCNQIAGLIRHLPEAMQPQVLSATTKLVERLVGAHGIVIEVPKGRFIHGSSTYVSELLPILAKALESKDYLPRSESSPWRDLWERAVYRIRLDVSESQEGNYLSSDNRLTRIEAGLTLSSLSGVIWQTKPTARSAVPLPNLPAYLARRVATSRSDEFENLLYQSAREQIDEKFRVALQNVPRCPSSARAVYK
jgi:hypothetical protein